MPLCLLFLIQEEREGDRGGKIGNGESFHAFERRENPLQDRESEGKGRGWERDGEGKEGEERGRETDGEGREGKGGTERKERGRERDGEGKEGEGREGMEREGEGERKGTLGSRK